ncbi:MAG: nucleoside hydrolase [Anaerolineae bacterium]|nr:nucleoside hydrolase [Gemmatimonadaceae bacterium]
MHGNAEVSHATRNAREVSRRSGIHASVVAGAAHPLARPAFPARETHGPEGLGYHVPAEKARPEHDHATACIISAARSNKGLTFCFVGPLTNLARALDADAEAFRSVGPIFVMGGAINVRGTKTRWSEFNWWADPEAVQHVLHHAARLHLDIRLVPLDVTRRIAIHGDAIRKLRKAGTQDADALFWADALGFYAEFHREWEQFDGAIVNDALAIALADDASLATWRTMRIGVSLGDDDRRGAIVLDDPDGAEVQVALEVRARDVMSLIGERVFSRWLDADALLAGAAAADRWLSEHPLHENSG